MGNKKRAPDYDIRPSPHRIKGSIKHGQARITPTSVGLSLVPFMRDVRVRIGPFHCLSLPCTSWSGRQRSRVRRRRPIQAQLYRVWCFELWHFFKRSQWQWLHTHILLQCCCANCWQIRRILPWYMVSGPLIVQTHCLHHHTLGFTLRSTEADEVGTMEVRDQRGDGWRGGSVG